MKDILVETSARHVHVTQETLEILYEMNQILNCGLNKETLEILVPIAHRLGINHIKSELEDLCFKYIYPEEYREIVEGINKKKEGI